MVTIIYTKWKLVLKISSGTKHGKLVRKFCTDCWNKASNFKLQAVQTFLKKKVLLVSKIFFLFVAFLDSLTFRTASLHKTTSFEVFLLLIIFEKSISF